MKKLKLVLISMLGLLLCSLFSFGQKKNMLYKSVLLQIESVEMRKDSVFATLENPFNIGIKNGMSAKAYQIYRGKTATTNEVNFATVGSGRILSTGKKLVAFIKLNDPAKSLDVEDLIEVNVPIPDIPQRGVLSDLAFNRIVLTDNYKIPFFTLQSIWDRDNKIYQDSLYNEMSFALKEIYDMIKDDPQGKSLDSTLTEGNYKGNSVMKMLADPKQEDLESFLFFVYSFPGKYIGTNYKFSETYATWLINRAPKSHKEVMNKLMPIYKNKALFLKALEKYRYDIKKEGHVTSIVGEVITLHEQKNDAEAEKLNEFAKALAYEVNDNDGKAWYWLVKAEMLHDDGDYKAALPFCDSSLVYAKLSSSREYELNAQLKKLFCLVYSRQYQLAAKAADELTLTIESYKNVLPSSVYFKNLMKKYEYEGNAYYKNGEYSKALVIFNKIVEANIALNTYESLTKNGFFYKFIGQVNNEQGLVEEALKNFFKAAKIYEANTDTLELANIQSEIAYSYNIKGDYKKSIEYTELSRKNSIAVNDNVNIGYTYSVDGSSYWNQGDYAAAEKSHKKSIEYREKTGRYGLQGDSWNKLGALYLESGSKRLALAAYDSAIAKYTKINDNNSIADMYNKQGTLFANDENYATAVTYYEKANGVSTKSTADALLNLARAWNDIDSVKARQYFEKCMKSCQETEDLALEFDATTSFAYLAYTISNPTAGDALYNRCLILSKKLQYESTKASCYNLKAYSFKTQTKLDSAGIYYQKALNINDTLSPISAIYGWENLANIHTSKGDFNSALLAYTKAIDLAKKTNNQLAYGSALGASSFVYGLVGEFEQGLKNSDTALSIFNKTGNIVRLANTYISRGTLLENQGRYKEAIRSFQIADSIYVDQKLNEYRTTAFTDMGVVYHKQGDHDNSYKFHKMALDLLKKGVVDETYLLTAGNVAEALVYQKKYPEGEKELLRLIPLAKTMGINRVVSGLDLALGKLYYETDQHSKAQPYYKDAYDFALKSSEKEKIVDALTHLGLIALKENNIKLAEDNFVRAAEVTENFQIAYGWESFYQLGLIYYNQKNYEKAIANFKKATLQLDKNTENLYGGEAATKIYNNDPRKADLYAKLTLAYYNTGDIAEAWNYANRSNIAGIKELSGSLNTSTNNAEKNEALKKILAMQQQKKQLEETASKQDGDAKKATLKKIEIQENDYRNFLDDVVIKFKDLATYLSSSSATEFTKYKTYLPKDVAVLLFMQSNTTLMIFSLTNEKLAVDTMTIDVNKKIEDLIATIKNTGRPTGTGGLSLRSDPLDEEEPTQGGDFKKQSNELYDILIGSVYDKIKGKDKLCIVPSGVFSNLPFQCLGKQVGKDKFEFLLQEFDVFYTNQMSIFRDASTLKNRTVNIKSFAAFGVPDPTLTYNIKEVQDIGRILNVKSGIFDDKTATESAAKESLISKKYIHFATHGVLNYSSDFSQSYLKLLPDTDTTTGNNGRLTIREIQGLGIADCDMVILSACQTAVSKELVEGWNISPANSFLNSNVKTVIATLWKVADEPTGLLMEYFYANLTKDASITKLDALRKAQIKLSQNPKFAHPNYWGAFVLYGGWE